MTAMRAALLSVPVIENNMPIDVTYCRKALDDQLRHHPILILMIREVLLMEQEDRTTLACVDCPLPGCCLHCQPPRGLQVSTHREKIVQPFDGPNHEWQQSKTPSTLRSERDNEVSYLLHHHCCISSEILLMMLSMYLLLLQGHPKLALNLLHGQS